MPLAPSDQIDLSPEELALLDGETEFAKANPRFQRLPKVPKLEKDHRMLLRVLPVEIGSNKAWFGRFGQHWCGKGGSGRPLICKRVTAPSLGGDQLYDCPICKFVAESQKSSNPGIAERAGQCFAEPLWYTVVLVTANDNGKSRSPVAVPEPDCWVAHEWHLYRAQWDQLSSIWAKVRKKVKHPGHPKAGADDVVNADITDPIYGRDVWLARTGKGYEIRQQDDPTPLADPSRLDEVMQTIWESVHLPDIKIPDDAAVKEHLAKVKDYILRGGQRAASQGDDIGDDSPPADVAPAPAKVETPTPRQETARSWGSPKPAAQTTQLPPARQQQPARAQTTVAAPKPAATPAPVRAAQVVVGTESEDGEDEGVAQEFVDPAPIAAEPADYEAPTAPLPPPAGRSPVGGSLMQKLSNLNQPKRP